MAWGTNLIIPSLGVDSIVLGSITTTGGTRGSTGNAQTILIYPGDVPALRTEFIPCQSGVTIKFIGFLPNASISVTTGIAKNTTTQTVIDSKTKGTYLINVTDTTGCTITLS